jgi:diguanylate cyclase (GGDEF)-like protein
MADWKSRWRSLVGRRRDRDTVLGLNEAAQAAAAESAAASPSADSDEDGLASDDVAAVAVDAAAGALEHPDGARGWGDVAAPAAAEAGTPAEAAAADSAAAEAAPAQAVAETAAAEAAPAAAEVAPVEMPAKTPATEEAAIDAAPAEAATEPAPAAPAAALETDLVVGLRAKVRQLDEALARERASRERLEREVSGLSDYDALTGLVSARRFNDRLGLAVTHALRQKHKLAIVQLGVDRFESVREELGASAGDDLLRGVALALESTLRQGDTIARLGADPVFTVLLPGVKRDEDITVIADKLRLALRSPFTIGGSDLLVTASVGIALFPDDGSDTDSLLQSAALAMARARDKGGDAWDVHAPGSRARAAQRQARETALQRALVRGGLELYWEPVVACGGGAIVGVESLLRWRGGDRPPVASDFVALAEVSGLAVPLGQWLLRAACRQAGEWRRHGHEGLVLGVSISARQLAHAAFAKLVGRVLDEAGLPASSLELAIPASELAVLPDAVERLAEMRGLGLRTALDAFGAADSRLADLHRFPLDTVRLDAGVVRDSVASPDQAALIRACVALARSRRLRVLAPGADGEPHRALLVKLHCDAMFGRVCGGPMAAADTERLLRAWRDPAGEPQADAPGRRLL